jgi:hypothetical protein
MTHRNILLLAVALSISVGPALAQDAAAPPPPAGLPSDYSAGSTVSTGAGGQPLLPEGNPLSGLFTPQPQYPTPQSQANPQADVPDKYSANPIGGLFNVSAPKDANAPPGGTNNMLQNLLTGQNPYQTPQAQQNQNPQPQAQYVVPGFGQAKLDELQKAGIQYKVNDGAPKDPNDYPDRIPDPKPAADAGAEKKDATAAKDKDSKSDKDGKDKTAKDGKDKDGKDKDKSKDDKDKTADKDKDGKDADKDKTADADKEKDAKDKDKEAQKPAGPYNALKDAIALMNGGRTEQALAVLAAALKQNPLNAEGHYLAAVGFVTMRDYKMAADEYRLVLRLVPATQLASLAVEGLKKIGAPAVLKDAPSPKYPALRQSTK